MEFERKKIGIQHIVEMHSGHLSEDNILKGRERFIELDSLLKKVNYDTFKTIMQSIRLIYLSYSTFHIDVDLSYTLLTGAIENLSQAAINRTDSSLKSDSIQLSSEEKLIQDFCLKNDLKNWFNKEILHHKKLKRKFIEFVLRYAPFEQWYELEEKITFRTSPPKGYEDILPKKLFTEEYHTMQRHQSLNFYPNELDLSVITKLLGDTYDYRSRFIHSGESIPITIQSSNRFFEDVIDVEKRKRFICISFELLQLLARISLFEFIKRQYKEENLVQATN